MIRTLLRPITLALLIATPIIAGSVYAEETTGEKVSETARDVKKNTKKNYRKAKKNVRDATGNGSVVEDVKDGTKNVGDSIENSAKDVKNKVD